MVKKFFLIAVVLLNVNFLSADENHLFVFAPDKWQKRDAGIYESLLTQIAVTSSGRLVASTDKAIYTSNDKAKTWKRVTFSPEPGARINDIACCMEFQKISAKPSTKVAWRSRIACKENGYLKIYIATEEGLYRFVDGAGSAERIFKGWADRRHINCIKIDNARNEKLYIGTCAGLFISNDSGRRWGHIRYFKNKRINDIAFLDDDIFVAAEDGIYKCNESFDEQVKVFGLHADENGEGNKENDNDENQNEIGGFLINCITVDADAKALYALTSKEVFASYDKGKSWQNLGSGFLPHHTRRLVFDKNSGCVYAATAKGLYIYTLGDEEKSKPALKNDYIYFLKRQIENEPTILQIQNAAIEDAEVSPNKIIKMRQGAKNKAWLPNLTVGFDYDADNNVDIDRRSTNDPDVFIIGPEDKSWGLDISLSWDLGELIWNDDQTNIDVRSKLMVQLREDILTEVTTLYFERRRLQLAIIKARHKGEALDTAMLRLQELTARIDALTGGYLSRCTEGS